jgi:hypothetical protein
MNMIKDLDEAIQHCLEVAEKEKCKGFDANTKYNCETSQGTYHYKCAEEHRQLAEWLKELKEAKKFIRKLQNELLKGTSFYSTSFYEENKELMDKLTEGVEYLDD